MAYYDNDDTIFAPATVPGTGAISVIRVSGPRAIEIADSIVSCKGRTAMHSCKGRMENSPQGRPIETVSAENAVSENFMTGAIASAKGYTIHYGTVSLPSGELLDEVLVSVFRAPHSYTGEDSVEISCHASSYIFNELSAMLCSAGARPAEAGEFTKRAFLNGKMDLAQAEAVADLIASQSAAAHRIAMNQLRGGFSDELLQIRAELIEIASLMELELDFSEEDVEFADRERLDALLEKAIARVDSLAASFRVGNAIRNGVPTAIVGTTNVGKSTLLNALLGEERAIVSEVHGTTRDTVEETLNIEGVLFRLIDTAGLRDTSEAVERIGIGRTIRKISEAEIVLGMVDGSRPPDEIVFQIRTILSRIASATPPADCSCQTVYVIVNKMDLIKDEKEAETLKTKLLHLIGELEKSSEVGKSRSDAARNCEICPKGNNDNADLGEIGENSECNKKVNDKNFYVLSTINKDINLYFISAKTRSGLDALRHSLAVSQKDKIDNAGAVTVTNLRHFEALRTAATALRRVCYGLHSGIPTDLLVQDIREAVDAVGSIAGLVTSEDLLSFVFSRFCIGK